MQIKLFLYISKLIIKYYSFCLEITRYNWYVYLNLLFTRTCFQLHIML